MFSPVYRVRGTLEFIWILSGNLTILIMAHGSLAALCGRTWLVCSIYPKEKEQDFFVHFGVQSEDRRMLVCR